MPELPQFNSEGLLPPGDYELTLDELERSHLVVGTPGEPWAVKTREQLVRNLWIFVDQLWQVGVKNIFIDGSFVENKPKPNDIDGYFECKLMDIATGDLQQRLNELDPHRCWTLGDADVAYLSRGTLSARKRSHDKFRNSRRTRERAAVPSSVPSRA